MVQVKLGQKVITALLDTGSSTFLVRAHLVPASLPILRHADLAGVYRNVCQWPVVRLLMIYCGDTHSVEVLKVDDLPFPVLLGRDAPSFALLVRSALAQMTAILDEEEQPEPSGLSAEAEFFPSSNWDMDVEFLRAQENDPTLASIRSNVAKEVGQVLDDRRACHVPHFEKVRRALWRIAGPELAEGVNC